MIYIFVVLLLIGILAIAIAVSENKNKTKDDAETVVIGNIQAGDTPPSDEEDTDRFCMLTEIDRKRNTYGHKAYDKISTI